MMRLELEPLQTMRLELGSLRKMYLELWSLQKAHLGLWSLRKMRSELRSLRKMPLLAESPRRTVRWLPWPVAHRTKAMLLMQVQPLQSISTNLATN